MQAKAVSDLERCITSAFTHLVSAGVYVFGINEVDQITIAKEPDREHFYVAPYRSGAFLFPSRDYLHILDGYTIEGSEVSIQTSTPNYNDAIIEYLLSNGQSFTIYYRAPKDTQVRNLLREEGGVMDIPPFEHATNKPNYLLLPAALFLAAAVGALGAVALTRRHNNKN